MLDHQQRLQAINDLHLQTFAEELSWYANGAKGRLHVDGTCRKLVKKSRIIRYVTLANALNSGEICYECIRRPEWNMAQMRIWRDSDELLQQRNRCQTMLQGQTHELNAMPALKNWQLVKIGENFLATLRKHDTSPDLDPWKTQIAKDIKSVMPGTIQPDIIAEETLRWAASDVLWSKLVWHTDDHDLFGGTKVIETFGEAEKDDFSSYAIKNGRNPIGAIAQAWIDMLRTGVTPNEATKLLLSDENPDRDKLFGNPTQRFLEQCPMTRTSKPGTDVFDLTESMWSYQQRIWQQHALIAAKLLLDAWTEHLAIFTAPAMPVLCAVEHTEQDILTSLATSGYVSEIITATLNWTLRSSDRWANGVVMCHPTLGAYIVRQGRGGVLGVRYEDPVQLQEEPTKSELEATVALWELHDDESIYRHIEAAYKAAKKL